VVESSKEGCDSESEVLPMIMMMNANSDVDFPGI
jgi:hypothetical protein